MPQTSISSVDRYETTDERVIFYCRTDTEFVPAEFKYRDDSEASGGAAKRYVRVTLTFYNPSTFRFELAANPEAGATETLNTLEESAVSEPVDLDISERDGQLIVESESLRVSVGLTEWSFRVERDTGTVLLEEQRADVDVRGELRTEPLGFEERVRNNGPRSVERTGSSFSLHPDEHLYGFGEKFSTFSKRSQEVTSWTVEPMGTMTERAYKNVPFHLSSRGYGLLIDTTQRVEYDLGSTSSASVRIDVADDTFSSVFFDGPSFKSILAEYTAFSGRVTRPPKWSFGVWMSRLGYESRDHLESIVTRLREEGIPADVVHLDPFWMREFHSCDLEWDTDQFPDPEGMIEWLDDRGFRLSLWEHPYVPVGTDAFETGAENGYFVTDSTGKPYVMDGLCQGDYRGAIVDFTDPDAVSWWQAKHRRLLEMGVDVFKTDYGEGIPADSVFENGTTGRTTHNYYPFLYNEAVYDAIAQERGTDEALVWGRSAWIGSQQFPMYWGGDAQTSFHGMASALRGGLSLSMTGFPFWSHDIGGFRGTPDEEVYIRWSQFGLLSSHARCHGTTPREPWAFGEEAVRNFKKYARLRYRLIPYLYSFAERATSTGVPLVRPLVMEYQNDPRTYDIGLEYMLGDALLVAPVFDASDQVSVYLPEGDDWVYFWTDEYYEGEQTRHLETERDELPLFVRADSIVPMCEPGQTVPDGTPEEVQLRVTPARNGDVSSAVQFYDADRDSTIDIHAETKSDGLALEIDEEERTELFVVTVTHVDVAPESVRVNQRDIGRVGGAPDPGAWTYDEDERTVTVNLS